MSTPHFFSDKNKDVIEFRAKELIRKVLMHYPITLEMQNDYEFIRDYGNPELVELIESVCRAGLSIE